MITFAFEFRGLAPALILIAWLFGFSATAQSIDHADVELSWTGGRAFVPGAAKPVSPQDVALAQRLPVVLYMHGCSGPDGEDDLAWARHLAELDFIVIVPNRFARADKAPSCWPDRNPAVHEMRRAELLNALDRINASAWADTGNIFLMGFSEGADAVMETAAGGARAAILLSWTCHRVHKISIADGVPVLSVMWDQRIWWRPWNRGEAGCAGKFSGRAGFEAVELFGRGHATYEAKAARSAVDKFLNERLSRSGAS